MSRLTRCVVVLGVLALVAGCASNTGAPPKALILMEYPHAAQPTLTDSPDDHMRIVGRVIDRDAKALIEDLDLLFLSDRPTRLSHWQDR